VFLLVPVCGFPCFDDLEKVSCLFHTDFLLRELRGTPLSTVHTSYRHICVAIWILAMFVFADLPGTLSLLVCLVAQIAALRNDN
jgi:hypothetical protein